RLAGLAGLRNGELARRDLLIEYMDGREQGWRMFDEGLHRRDADLVRRATGKQREAERVLERVKAESARRPGGSAPAAPVRATMGLEMDPKRRGAMSDLRRELEAPPARTFDVICAGEALWNVTAPLSALRAAVGNSRGPLRGHAPVRFLPGGGAVNTA